MMKRTVSLSALVGGLVLGSYVLGGWAAAADQTILGKSFIVKNPGAADKRRISGVAKEQASPNTIVGDPTIFGSAGGAILTVIANGANSTSQTFNLPQGNSLSGKPFWRSTDLGFKYKDSKGEQGAVKSVTIRLTAGGIFTIKAVVRGKNGPVNVVPPNPGTDGFITLKLGISPGAGDRYCVQYANGELKNKGTELFKVRRPQGEGCPGGTTTTTTSSTTTTTIYSSPSRAFLDAPPDLLD